MGLDMYVYRTKEKIAKVGRERPKDTEIPSSKYMDAKGKIDFNKYENAKKKVEVFYWRKHSDLHGWFMELWERNGGKPDKEDFGFGDYFNGDDWVRIDAEDLDALEDVIGGKGTLPHTRGFFFGASFRDDKEKKYDLEFIAKARKEMARGYALFYTSSW